MQALQSPHFVLAQAGDSAAIAALLSEKISSVTSTSVTSTSVTSTSVTSTSVTSTSVTSTIAPAIKVRVGRKGEDLGVLIEAATIPNQVEMMAWIRQELTMLQPETVRRVRVFGLQTGQKTFAWLEKFELVPPALLKLPMQSLVEWLNQGQAQEPDTEQISLEQAGTQQTLANKPLEAIALRARSNPESQQLAAFLRFYLGSEATALLPLVGVKEVLTIAKANILAVPFMPDAVMGVYNYRGEVLWLVDLAIHLGLTPPRNPTQPASYGMTQPSSQTVTAIALELAQKSIAFVVSQVSDIETHDADQMQSASADLFSPQLLPFIQGYLTRSSSPVLNLEALMQDPALQGQNR